MLSLKENGELIKLRNKWWYDKAECSLGKDNQEASHNELTLSNVAGIFYILIGGLLISVFVAMIEFCCRNKANRAAAAAAAAAGGLGAGGGGSAGKSNGSMLLGPANVGVGPGVVASTHQRNALAESMHHAKAKLTIQASRDYDNGRVGVSIGRGKRGSGSWFKHGSGQGLQVLFKA